MRCGRDILFSLLLIFLKWLKLFGFHRQRLWYVTKYMVVLSRHLLWMIAYQSFWKFKMSRPQQNFAYFIFCLKDIRVTSINLRFCSDIQWGSLRVDTILTVKWTLTVQKVKICMLRTGQIVADGTFLLKFTPPGTSGDWIPDHVNDHVTHHVTHRSGTLASKPHRAHGMTNRSDF